MNLLLRLGFMLAVPLVLVTSPRFQDSARVSAASSPEVSFNTQNAAPRQVEDSTQKSVARDYAAAWQSMADALDQNRTDLLSANFIGTAGDKLTETIKQQQKVGLHQRYVDKGHQVDAIFYSPEGSAIQLRDTAHLEIQIMEAGKVLQSQDLTLHYVALLTAAENSWKVRVIEAVPAF
jgi:hypothetical protein